MTFTYPRLSLLIDTFANGRRRRLITPEKLEYGIGVIRWSSASAPYGYVLNSDPCFRHHEEKLTEENVNCCDCRERKRRSSDGRHQRGSRRVSLPLSWTPRTASVWFMLSAVSPVLSYRERSGGYLRRTALSDTARMRSLSFLVAKDGKAVAEPVLGQIPCC